jgi:serine/threonine-protein kinase
MSDYIKRLVKALGPRYRVDRRIGRGGAAHVYIADDTLCHRQVAVKILRRELASSVSADRFRAEIRVAARLQHPNIVPIYATGEVDGLPYYVMPFIDGETLRDRLDWGGRLSIAEALRVVADVARALDFAHRRHVVHRDIKPENVMLCNGRAMLLDFGIALSIDEAAASRHTSPGMYVGTIGYMSPEQASGERAIDGRSDIYSLACVAYEMLSGEPPFSGDPADVITCHATEQPLALAAIRPEIPHSISHAVSRALGKSPAERVATAGELLTTLRRASVGHTSARPCIAVLSAANPSEGTCAGASSDEITEHVAHALADLPDVDVAPGSAIPVLESKLHVSHIARQSGADAILFTNVSETTHYMRLSGMLLGAVTGVSLWSGTFSGLKGDCESVLGALAPQLAGAVSKALTRVADPARDTWAAVMPASA